MEVKLKYLTSTIALVTLFALSPQQVIAQEQVPVVAKHLTTITPPEPIKRIEPEYPIQAARKGKSGSVKLSFVVQENGKVSDILITDVIGDRSFGKAARKALKKWKYEPAFENGKPIEQCLDVQLDFKVGGGGVGKSFRKKYASAIEALDKNDIQDFKKSVDKLASFEYGTIEESNLYHTLAAKYAELIKDKELEYFHLSEMSLAWGDSIEAQRQKFSILNKKFFLAVNTNRLNKAFEFYNKLMALEVAKPYYEKYNEIIGKVDAFIGGKQNIVINANIEENDFWSYSLVRNEFSLTDVKGSLNKLDIRCANKRHVYSVEENNTWTIPKAWKGCNIYVYGDDNASFKLVEHPFKA